MKKTFLKFIFLFAVIITCFAAAAKYALAEEKKMEIIVLGDSLSAGYEIPLDQAYPAVLQKKLEEKGYKVTVSNNAVSGDTTAGAFTRMHWILGSRPDFMIIELGANDMLRGVDIKETEKNLVKLVNLSTRTFNTPTLLMGMKALPNFGNYYSEEYENIYKRVAADFDVALYPFFLEGVIGNKELLLEDQMHPNAEGVKVMVEKTLPYVEKMINDKLAKEQ